MEGKAAVSYWPTEDLKWLTRRVSVMGVYFVKFLFDLKSSPQ
jgi:hypothetical protein